MPEQKPEQLPLELPFSVPGVPRELWPKCNRLKSGQPLRVVDLFSGCGGWTCGFEVVGEAEPRYRTVAAVEKDDDARESHRRNFERSGPYRALGAIEGVQVQDLVSHLPEMMKDPSTDPHEAIDILIGSPPCQPFTQIGRAKLRSLSDNDINAVFEDERVALVAHYLHLLKQLRPLAFAIENVSQYTRFKGRNIAEDVAVEAEKAGYSCRYALLNAVWYGVPQFRERVIILGIHKSLGVDPVFPPPTHHYDLPSGYITSRASRKDSSLVLPPDDHFLHVTDETAEQPAVTVEGALSDLPRYEGNRKGLFEKASSYPWRGTHSDYQRQMRRWHGFSVAIGDLLKDHRTRTLKRDYDTFARMAEGDRYDRAHEHALARWREAQAEERKQRRGKLSKERIEELKREIVPPYPTDKFLDKWQKLHRGHPSHTLTAHLSHDCYSHIHYRDPRTITIREAARLQSFPDGFDFGPIMNPSYHQIGNAVPPLMAKAIAETLLKTLEDAIQRKLHPVRSEAPRRAPQEEDHVIPAPPENQLFTA